MKYKKLLLFSLVFMSFLSCVLKKEITYDSLKKMQASHVLNNNILLKPMNKLVSELEVKNSLFNILVLKIDSISPKEFNVYIKKSNLGMEQLNFQLNEDAIYPKGYTFIDDIPVLLYGNLEVFFTRERKPLNILRRGNSDIFVFDIGSIYSGMSVNIFYMLQNTNIFPGFLASS